MRLLLPGLIRFGLHASFMTDIHVQLRARRTVDLLLHCYRNAELRLHSVDYEVYIIIPTHIVTIATIIITT